MNVSDYLVKGGRVLTLSPTLACEIGVNGALFLQQAQYWISRAEDMHRIEETGEWFKIIDGEMYIKRSYNDWRDHNFPFWSVETIKRIVSNLEQIGALKSTQIGTDRSKWYAINYDLQVGSGRPAPSGQVDPLEEVKTPRCNSLKLTQSTISNKSNKSSRQEKPPKAGHQRAWEAQWESPTTTDIEDQYERILDTRVVDPLSYRKKADVCRILANLNVTTDQLIQALDNAPYDDIRLANVIDLVRRQQTDSKPSHPFQEQIERYVTGAIDANGLTDDCKRWLKANGWSKDKLTRTTHKKDLSQTISRILSNGEFKHGTRIAVQ